MRRKLFLIFLITIFILFLLDASGVDICNWNYSKYYGTKSDFQGEVTKILFKEDKTELQVALRYPKAKILLSYYGKKENCENLLYKNISFYTTLERGTVQRNPHCFDYEKYLKGKGIRFVGKLSNFQVIETPKLKGIEAIFYKTVKYPIRRIEKYLDNQKKKFSESLKPEIRGLVLGILFGDISLMSQDIYSDFRKNGTAHILAVSGLHIGILYGIYKRLRKRFGAGALDVGFFGVLAVYGNLAMWSPSVSRAIGMICLRQISIYKDFRYDSLSAMSFMGLILIGKNPYIVFDIGFQLSFLAIISIRFLEPHLSKFVHPAFSTVLAVNIGLAMYQIYQFNFLSLTSIFANIIIVFLAGYLLPIALMGLVIFIMLGTNILNPVISGMAMVLEWMNKWATIDGFGGFELPSPSLGWVIFITTSIMYFASEDFGIRWVRQNYKGIAKAMVLICIISLIGGWLDYSSITYDDLVFVDVGQGDCLHIRSGRKNVLIDGGGNFRTNVGEKVLKPYLLKNGENQVDLAIVTHLHTDHAKGISELSKVFRIKKLGVFTANRIQENKLKDMFNCDEIIYLKKGDIIQLEGKDYIKVLGPVGNENVLDERDENKNSLVLKVVCKGAAAIMTGDIDKGGEGQILDYNKIEDVRANVLKVSHHGSRYSSDDRFIEEVKPELAVIQVGKNIYGHPTKEILDKFNSRGVLVYRNDELGAIGLELGKSRVKRVDCIKKL